MLLLAACLSPSTDTGKTDSAGFEIGASETADSDPGDTAGDTSETACPGGITGPMEGGFSGAGQFLLLRAGYGGWSDGCYGGRIDPPHEAVGGAFDWPAEFYAGAGSPEPRPIRAAGCAAADHIELSIL